MHHYFLTMKKSLFFRYQKCDVYIQQMKMGELPCQPGCSAEETLEAVILKELSVIRDRVGKICLDELPCLNSPLVMALCGSKGTEFLYSYIFLCGLAWVQGSRHHLYTDFLRTKSLIDLGFKRHLCSDLFQFLILAIMLT